MYVNEGRPKSYSENKSEEHPENGYHSKGINSFIISFDIYQDIDEVEDEEEVEVEEEVKVEEEVDGDGDTKNKGITTGYFNT